MTALAADRRHYRKWTARSFRIPVAAATTIYNGALVAVDTAGRAVPAADTAGLRVVGLAQEQSDNSAGAAEATYVLVLAGVFKLDNDATNPVAQADQGRPCFVVDDQTVGDQGGGSKVVAGIVDAVESDGVYLYVGPEVGLAGSATSGIETVTSGALSLYTRSSLISVTGTQAYTLAAGLYEGQRKSVIVTVAASTPDGTLTPATFADGTSIDLDAVLESVELEWHDTGGWRVINISGATITA